jgi:hypothetical protein
MADACQAAWIRKLGFGMDFRKIPTTTKDRYDTVDFLILVPLSVFMHY